jgi:hypothetical protein
MKRLIITIFALHCLAISFGQNTDIKSMVDSLQYLNADTLDCKAALYWRIVAKGDKAIPFLIDKLTDTTATKIKYHCKKTSLNVGEVAHFALKQIADFPAFLVTKMQFDLIAIDNTGEGCWSFYDFLFIDANKPRYQKDVRNWYANQHSKYKPKKISRKKQTACQKQYGIDRFYRWKE